MFLQDLQDWSLSPIADIDLFTNETACPTSHPESVVSFTIGFEGIL
jgi:hypothetical protein